MPAMDLSSLRKLIPFTAKGKGEAAGHEANSFACQLEHELHGLRILLE